MSEWLHARYGDVNNGHALVRADGISPHELPPELLSLTDRPPGALSRGERWWPSVGCGPVGCWWACWWCLPDDAAPRGGMVRTEVALRPLADVGDLTDLRPILCALGKLPSVPSPPDELMEAVWEALLAEDAPIVVPDLDLLPGVIAAVWQRLWPAARRGFSARVALSPPQGESGAAPWLYGVPEARRLEWTGARVLERVTHGPALSRGARWLLGGEDDSLARVLSSCFFEAPRIAEVKRAARIADQIDRLKASGAPSDGLALAKALETAAPAPEVLADLKQEALLAILTGLESESFDLPRSLRNLSPKPFQAEDQLRDALRLWVTRHGTQLGDDDVKLLLGAPTQSTTLSWWRDTTQAALKGCLTQGHAEWNPAALRWLALDDEACALEGLLPTDEATESRLMAQVEGAEPGRRALLLSRTRHRRWSRLHAALLRTSLAPGAAIAAQRAFPGDPLPGLRWLISTLPAVEGVRAYVQSPDSTLLLLIVERTKADPSSLAGLDPLQASWRSLWSAHVVAGGVPWPPNVDRAALCRMLIDALLVEEEPPGLVPKIAEDLAGWVCGHARRAELWARLSADSARLLRPRVATLLQQALERGEDVGAPEPELLNELIRQWGQRGPPATLLVRLLQWRVLTEEMQVCRWIDQWQIRELERHALSIGEQASAQRWAKLADLLYRRSVYNNKIGQGALLCSDLLSTYQRIFLRMMTGGDTTSPHDIDQLVRKVAELGAELAPDRLDSIWEAAGGKARQLSNHLSREAAWQEAARFANQGKLHRGLFALANALHEEFPLNEEVRQLRDLLDRASRRDTH